MSRAASLVVACVAAFVVGSCSAEGTAAPVVIAPDEVTPGCPSGDSTVLAFKAELNSGGFDPLRPTIERILVDEAGLKTVLALLSSMVPELTGEETRTLVRALTSSDGNASLNALKPHLINILEYVNGTSPFIAGKHPEPISALHEILTSCDAAEQLSTIRNLLALEVNAAPAGSDNRFVVAAAGSGEASYFYALLQAVDRASKVPKMKALLESIEVTDDGSAPDGSGGVRVGRDAFLVLAKLLAGNIAAPDFQFAPTRQLLEDVLVPQLDGDGDAEDSLDELLDLLGLLVESDATTFEGMQAFMGCVDRHDGEAKIPGMLFDYLTIDELPFSDLLDDAVLAGEAEDNDALRLALIELLDAALKHPDTVSDVTHVAAAFVEEDVAEITISTALSMKGKGVLTELLDFIGTLVDCKGLEL